MKDLSPFIDLDGGDPSVPMYRQIYETLRRSILNGEFGPGMRLPATRQLAEQLGVSRITVVNAYDQLFAEGYLEGKAGSGTYVAGQLPDDMLRTRDNAAAGRTSTAPLRLSQFGERISKEAASSRVNAIARFQPFQNGLTAVDEFPFETWSRIASKFHRNPPRSILGYGDPQGFLPLREAVTDHLRSARGVICDAEQVIITSGAQQALDLTARLFLGSGDTVLIEDPGYVEARNVFRSTGADLLHVPVDEEGIDLQRIPKGGPAPKLVYVTPSHQFPLGITMSLCRRLALLEWAKQNGAWIIEDDYNSEYRYAGRPLASLQGLDGEGRVIYIGTFSKTVFPSLRIGCAVVPRELVEVFTSARAVSDVHSSLIDQAILAEFIAEGHFSRHVRRMRKLYEQRQQVLLEECEKHLAGILEVERADAGMHLVGWLPEGADDKKISSEAAQSNLKLSPLTAYSKAPQKRGGFILGYTAFDAGEIRRGVLKMKELLQAHAA